MKEMTYLLSFAFPFAGSACTQGTEADREWLLHYFGLFTAFGSYSDFATLKSNFHGVRARYKISGILFLAMKQADRNRVQVD